MLPTYRYPQPFPVHNQSWSPALVEERPQVTVRIADRRYVLRLKGGPRYRRQRLAFLSMCSGEAEYGELALYRQGTDLFCKMVAWLPRKPARRAERHAVRPDGTRCARDRGQLKGRDEGQSKSLQSI